MKWLGTCTHNLLNYLCKIQLNIIVGFYFFGPGCASAIAYSMFCISIMWFGSSAGSMLPSITGSAWQRFCYVKQQGTRGNVYLALCHAWDEQHLNKRSSICSLLIYLPALFVRTCTADQVHRTKSFSLNFFSAWQHDGGDLAHTQAVHMSPKRWTRTKTNYF